LLIVVLKEFPAAEEGLIKSPSGYVSVSQFPSNGFHYQEGFLVLAVRHGAIVMPFFFLMVVFLTKFIFIPEWHQEYLR